MRDPFLLDRPAVVSFSGGRTSGYMLFRILQSFGGSLPSDVVVVFSNTGKERPETLDFVERCSQRWGVTVRWLEYRNRPVVRTYHKGKRAGLEVPGWDHFYEEVDYAAASRNGEPFEMVIAARSFLPNSVMRFCTGELKIKTTSRFVRDALGWQDYVNALGLRRDEPHRYAKLHSKRTTRVEQTLFGEEEVEEGYDAERMPGEEPDTPLYHAGVTLEEVMAFWHGQRGGLGLGEWLSLPRAARPGFDLELDQDEGNCDLCFLKGVQKLLNIMARRPDLAGWWAEQERKIGKTKSAGTGRFRQDRPPYAELLRIAQGADLPAWCQVDELPCHCTD